VGSRRWGSPENAGWPKRSPGDLEFAVFEAREGVHLPIGDWRFVICDFRTRQSGSSSPLKRPITDVGRCARPAQGLEVSAPAACRFLTGVLGLADNRYGEVCAARLECKHSVPRPLLSACGLCGCRVAGHLSHFTLLCTSLLAHRPSPSVTAPAIGRTGISGWRWVICDLRFSISNWRFEICDFRPQQMGSSPHPTLPITDTGKCVTRGSGRRLAQPYRLRTFSASHYSSLVTAPAIGRTGIRGWWWVIRDFRFSISNGRFEICDFRTRQLSSSSHRTRPKTDMGKCARPARGSEGWPGEIAPPHWSARSCRLPMWRSVRGRLEGWNAPPRRNSAPSRECSVLPITETGKCVTRGSGRRLA